MKEINIQKSIQMAVSRLGARLFRNNVGQAVYPDGSRVDYGLCKGSSDLVGWKSVTVTPDMVGRKVALFLALEVKGPKGAPTPLQVNFIERVQEAGGIAGIVRSDKEALELVGR